MCVPGQSGMPFKATTTKNFAFDIHDQSRRARKTRTEEDNKQTNTKKEDQERQPVSYTDSFFCTFIEAPQQPTTDKTTTL